MYGIDTVPGIVLAILFLIGFAVLGVLSVVRPLNFGEYKSFFVKFYTLKYNYYIAAIIFRLLIAIAICAFN